MQRFLDRHSTIGFIVSVSLQMSDKEMDDNKETPLKIFFIVGTVM
ncbi:unnamed protein product [Brugia timori]|uniref:Uncharacterized protein n=1 Tax=Brugia timori TaxID=42155 RepID=A0A0R3R4Z2_9BILA|nr:unnamed protein product [Brugia timori]